MRSNALRKEKTFPAEVAKAAPAVAYLQMASTAETAAEKPVSCDYEAFILQYSPEITGDFA